MSFNTDLLDEIIRSKRDRREQERQTLLAQVKQWLDDYGSQYGIGRAYIFGSLTRPDRFTETSDVDIAVEQIYPEEFFTVISLLVTALGSRGRLN
ncbi:MAG: nucleotidyltransferase family protein [Hormoscilla sp.]